MIISTQSSPGQLYRQLLKAAFAGVNYSLPRCSTLRHHIRSRLTHTTPTLTPDVVVRVNRTLLFLHAAARAPGLERRLLYALAHVWFYDRQARQRLAIARSTDQRNTLLHAINVRDHMLYMLNSTLRLAL